MAKIAAFFVEGGFWMIPVGAVSFMVAAIAVERVIFLFFKYNIDGKQFMDQVEKLVKANNVDRAVKLCNAAPSAALATVVKAGLTHANKGEAEIIAGVEEANLEVMPLLNKRTAALAGMGFLATLLGLLGTVMGLIEAFTVVAKAPADQKSALLSAAIGVAMNTTAFGLMVAIPTILIHMMLMGITKKITNEIDYYTVRLENLLFARGKGEHSGS
jgi:biopolymer transport protein ExbB/TolQ